MNQVTSFQLKYTNIEDNISKPSSITQKVEKGDICVFSEGNGIPKFLFYRNPKYKPTLLIKIIPNIKSVKNLVKLKSILDKGIPYFKNSPFAHAVPIGYGKFSKDESRKLNLNPDNDMNFTIYIYKHGCNGLNTIFQEDNFQDIIDGKNTFKYALRNILADKIIDLFFLLEDLSEYYDGCPPYQILHHDIKPENYIIDEHNNIFIVDFDQSGYLNTFDKSNFVKPLADLRQYDFLFLPYEVIMDKCEVKSKIDIELWEYKEVYTERWMAWLLILRILTGIENPFMFCQSYDYQTVYQFIHSNKITDLFSKRAYELGDIFKKYELNLKNKYIQNLTSHFNRTLSYGQREMMNSIFLKGFSNFFSRPSFYSYKNEYYKYEN